MSDDFFGLNFFHMGIARQEDAEGGAAAPIHYPHK